MSTSSIFRFSSAVRRQHEGPLGIHIDAYEALLGEQGYSRGSTYVHLHVVADLSRWLKRRRLDVDDVDERTVERYLLCLPQIPFATFATPCRTQEIQNVCPSLTAGLKTHDRSHA
jgi:hypothetical protein